ncbi:MAG TPA: hypothetical protein VER96_38375 [Polyangiaceae bacterium]|nr:hypothetical protein [Polyangiaceae bacterium]
MKPSNREFVLRSGRTVSLVSLRQDFIYAGLLEGLPTRKRNDAMVARLLDAHRDQDGHGAVLIQPIQTAIKTGSTYPFGEPAALPIISCVGLFHSGSPARDQTKDCSDLTIIWFQDDFTFPPSEEILRGIAGVDWNSLARDGEY